MLKERFLNELQKNELIVPGDKIVVGVSGGIDSMTLIALLRECDMDAAIAHCNFSLRGKESDGDQQFVKSFALKNGIPFHCITFDTLAEAASTGESIQITARRLRYDWFEALCEGHKYTKIAIAHNADDSIETFFINLTRGTGIKGLTGIPKQRGKVVRPLLFATREQIVQYAVAKGVAYREDHTNNETKYLRNKIRHQLIPLFRELSSDFDATMLCNIEKLETSRRLLEYGIDVICKKAVQTDGNRTIIDIAPIAETPSAAYTLFEIVRRWHFSAEQASDMMRALEKGKSGQRFTAPQYEATTDRNRLLIDKTEQAPATLTEIQLNENAAEEFGGVLYTTQTIDRTALESLNVGPDTALFDRDKIVFPLVVRPIREGDRMRPLGMKGRKKISDLLTDAKVALADKKKGTVVLSGEEIIWLTQIRSAENYKVSEKSCKLVVIKAVSKR